MGARRWAQGLQRREFRIWIPLEQDSLLVLSHEASWVLTILAMPLFQSVILSQLLLQISVFYLLLTSACS